MIFNCITNVLVSPNIIVFNDMLFSGSLQLSPLKKLGDISNPKYYQTQELTLATHEQRIIKGKVGSKELVF